MDTDLILIASPRAQGIDPTLVDAVSVAVGSGRPSWLADGEVCEWSLAETDATDHVDIEQTVRSLVGDRPIDVGVVPMANRRKRLLIADMDSTIIGQECIDELAAAGGVGAEISAITERAMKGELVFEDALRERVAKLAGLPSSLIDDLLESTITVNDGAATLVKTMQRFGAVTGLVSGGFIQFARHVAQRTGFDHVRANSLVIDNGVLTGRVDEPALGRDAKLETLRMMCDANGILPDEALAVGDGANDIAMVEAAGLGVAFHAKQALREVADVRIDHCGLTALLYLQGYAAWEFRG